MFSLLHGAYTWCSAVPEYAILLIGLDNAGKTTLLEQCKAILSPNPNNAPIPFEKIAPTVGLNIGRARVRGARLLLWDVGGQAGLRSIWPKYYGECNAVMFVIDCSDLGEDDGRLSEVSKELHNVMQSNELKEKPILIMANKQDVRGAFKKEDIVKLFALNSEINGSNGKHGKRLIHIQPVSAITGDGVKEGIEWIIDNIGR